MQTRKPLSPTPEEDARRLKALYSERTKLSQTEFGARFEIGNQGAVWQYLNGRRPLSLKAAKGFAAGLGVNIEDFSPAIAETIKAAEMLTGSIDQDAVWPFSLLDERKIQALDDSARLELERSVLDAAAQLGLDVKKQDGSE